MQQLSPVGQESWTLEERRTKVQERLYLRGTAFEAREKTAYIELASVLLRRSESYCGDVAGLLELSVAFDEASGQIRLGLPVAAMRTALRSLVTEMIEENKDAIADVVLDLIPAARLELPRDITVSQQVSYLLVRVLPRVWERRASGESEIELVVPRFTIRLGYDAALKIAEKLDLDAAIWRYLGGQHLTFEHRWRPRAREWAHVMLDWLADEIINIDRDAIWSEVLGGDAGVGAGTRA